MTNNPYTATNLANIMLNARRRMELEVLEDVADLFDLHATTFLLNGDHDAANNWTIAARHVDSLQFTLRENDQILAHQGRAAWLATADKLNAAVAADEYPADLAEVHRLNWGPRTPNDPPTSVFDSIRTLIDSARTPAPDHTQDATVPLLRNTDINLNGDIPVPPTGYHAKLHDAIRTAYKEQTGRTLSSSPDPYAMTLRPVPAPVPVTAKTLRQIPMVPIDQGHEVKPGTDVLNWRTADDSGLCTSTITALCSHPNDHNGDHEAIKADGTVQRRWRNHAAPAEEYPVPRQLADRAPLCPTAGLPAVLQQHPFHPCGDHRGFEELGRFATCTQPLGHNGDHEAPADELPGNVVNWTQN